jgi:hypothetical protein
MASITPTISAISCEDFSIAAIASIARPTTSPDWRASSSVVCTMVLAWPASCADFCTLSLIWRSAAAASSTAAACCSVRVDKSSDPARISEDPLATCSAMPPTERIAPAIASTAALKLVRRHS